MYSKRQEEIKVQRFESVSEKGQVKEERSPEGCSKAPLFLNI